MLVGPAFAPKWFRESRNKPFLHASENESCCNDFLNTVVFLAFPFFGLLLLPFLRDRTCLGNIVEATVEGIPQGSTRVAVTWAAERIITVKAVKAVMALDTESVLEDTQDLEGTQGLAWARVSVATAPITALVDRD